MAWKNPLFPTIHSYISYTSRELAMFSKTVQFLAHDIGMNLNAGVGSIHGHCGEGWHTQRSVHFLHPEVRLQWCLAWHSMGECQQHLGFLTYYLFIHLPMYLFIYIYLRQYLTVWPWLAGDSLYRPGWPQPRRDYPASASPGMGFKVCAIVPSSLHIWFWINLWSTLFSNL